MTLTCAFTLLAGASNLGATQYISNLGNIWNTGVGDIQTMTPGLAYGGMFAAGPGSAFSLDSVTIEFLTWGDPGYVPPGAGQGFHLQLYKRIGFFDLTLVGELGNPTLNPRPTQWPTYTAFFDYSPLNAITLDPSATYALAASQAPNGTDGPGILFTYSQSYTTPEGWQLLTTTEGTFDGSTVTVGSLFPHNLVMAVEATAVPEPAVPGLFLIAALAAAGLRQPK